MQKTLLITILLLVSVSARLVAQQINFNGARVMHTTGTYNTFLGYGTGQLNTGANNTFLGSNAAVENTTGYENTFVGTFTGASNTTATNNAFLGSYSGYSNTTGNHNAFFGSSAGYSNKTGDGNAFFGREAGLANTTGSANVFVGRSAGYSNTIGADNAFIGSGAGSSNTEGYSNTFTGRSAGQFNKTGRDNVFLGASAGVLNEIGSGNAFIGSSAGRWNTGNLNSFVGYLAGQSNIAGSQNTFLGFKAGANNQSSDNNTMIGFQADMSNLSVTNSVALGANARVAVSNAIVLGDPTNTSLNVGIGTDSPQFPLDVRGIINLRNRGTIKFSHLSNPNLRNGSTDQFLTVDGQGETVLAHYRLNIQDPNQWADKVFAPAYQLRPLASVAAFVRQHGHLPGVPSAAEVVREGVDIAKLNATLLEKIEELTLYSIQLEKANQQQQADIDELKRLVKQVLKK